MVANSVQPSKNTMVKATPWQWPQRLGHCRSQVIDHLPKEWIINSGDDSEAPKTVKCQICAVSKMHRLVQKQPSARATKPYEVLHFDLTIYGIREFDETTCIAHFTDEFTHYSWVFPLTDHREKTLMPVFKDLINRCDRSDIAIDSMVRIIRTGQKTSIDKRLENWIINQEITWDWSAKNTPEQNGTSERYGVLLTEKARCIREHAKLPEDLFPECYLAAEHLLNRTLNQALNWESPLVRMQKLTNQPIRPEIEHLKVYGCKAYPLLKGADAPPRGSKLKPRAFVGYLVGYNSTFGDDCGGSDALNSVSNWIRSSTDCWSTACLLVVSTDRFPSSISLSLIKVSQNTGAHRLPARRNSWTQITSLPKVSLKSWMIISNRRFSHSRIHCSILALTGGVFSAWYCSWSNSTILASDCLYRPASVCKICLMLDFISLEDIYWRADALTARWIVCILRSARLISFSRIDQVDCLCCRSDLWLSVSSVIFRVILTRFSGVNSLRSEMPGFIETK